MRKWICLLLILGGLCMTACTTDDGFSGGHPLTKEELASLSAEYFTEAEEPPVEGGFSDQVKVYWTEGGSVYHADRYCSHLKKASKVESGTVSQARRLGKEKACSACGGD